MRSTGLDLWVHRTLQRDIRDQRCGSSLVLQLVALFASFGPSPSILNGCAGPWCMSITTLRCRRYDIREVDEDLYMAVLAAARQ